MYESIPAPAHVAAFRFAGKLTGDDYDRCIAEVETRLAAFRRIGMFCDLTAMTGLSAEALGKDLRYALGKLGEYDRFARAALISERGWLDRVSGFAGRLLPDTEVRTFAAGEQAEAIAWAGAFASLDANAGGTAPAA
ncbi:STAS/SEC14 domain-containing protein [Luteimonas abyssi]|uniref:STAS/SEC14 domain-containing protein n=1 Tax=Luteimonas abyssi TaxID=1247514 RepID=UPI000737D0E5|nr:STAS/SEC14 domain-containing protein [Luteimonas abyssi]